MDIGRLRDYITFYRDTYTDDGMGGATAAHTVIGECYAEVKVPRSSNGIIGGKDIEVRTHIVIIRDKEVQLQKGDYVIWHGETLVIRNIRPNYYDGIIELDCVQYIEG